MAQADAGQRNVLKSWFRIKADQKQEPAIIKCQEYNSPGDYDKSKKPAVSTEQAMTVPAELKSKSYRKGVCYSSIPSPFLITKLGHVRKSLAKPGIIGSQPSKTQRSNLNERYHFIFCFNILMPCYDFLQMISPVVWSEKKTLNAPIGPCYKWPQIINAKHQRYFF